MPDKKVTSEDLHSAADKVGALEGHPDMEAAVQFAKESNWIGSPKDIDPFSLGYGVVIGLQAAKDARV